MKKLIAFILAFAVLGVLPRATNAQQQAKQPSETLIRNATVLTVTKGALQNTDILIRDGKIAGIGKNLKAGPTARIIDATGKYVMPGIIDCHSHMMLDDINEFTYSVTSMTDMRDVLDPTDINLYRALAGGVTSMNLLHGSANSIGGLNIVVKLKYGRPVEEFVFQNAPPGIKFALGENPKRSNFTAAQGQAPRYPQTRMGVEETIRDAFVRARDYKREWDEYRAAVAKGEKAIPPRKNLELEPIVEILEGKRYVHCHSYRADEILMLINLADEFGFKVKTFQHGLEGYKVAPEIAKHGAGVSIFTDSWAYKIEAYDAIPYNATIMTRAGIRVSVNSDSDERIRRLNIDAAKLVKYGMTEEEALKTITINPAWQLGIDKKTGSIEVGKDADLVIWSAHPFSVYARVETTFVDGEIFFDRSQDLKMRELMAKERAELEKADVNRAPGQGGTPPSAPVNKISGHRDAADAHGHEEEEGGHH
jgi:imidazolonepropionase-like amidohydrolase